MRTLIATMLLFVAAAAQAQSELPFKVDVLTKKIFPGQGGERKIEATRVAVGETIEYTLSYTNVTQNIIKDVKIALPVPPGFAYVVGSGKPAPLNALPTVISWSAGDVQAGATVRVVARLNLQRIPPKRNKTK
jgi:uncharacterized repeat protein (TIGR01451 family)